MFFGSKKNKTMMLSYCKKEFKKKTNNFKNFFARYKYSFLVFLVSLPVLEARSLLANWIVFIFLFGTQWAAFNCELNIKGLIYVYIGIII